MKKTIFLFSFIFVGFVLNAQNSWDFTATVPYPSTGYYLYYKITTGNTLTIVTIGNNGGANGILNIPSSVYHNGITYTVTKIADDAFKNCSTLTSVTIPNSVTSLGYRAFMNCTGLTSITLSNSIPYINGNCFQNCSSLTSITIPNSVVTIFNSAFSGCSNLQHVYLPNSLQYIMNFAFYNCTSLSHISIPNSVTDIRYCAFKNCSGLSYVTIGNSVTTIENDVFEGCTGLNLVYYSGTIEQWLNISFGYVTSNPLFYAHHLYINNNEVSNVIIPYGIDTIGSCVFVGCSSLTSINIPNTVTFIDNYAFYGCSGLTSIILPDSVTNIGSNAFGNCSGLTEIISMAPEAPFLESYLGYTFEGVPFTIPIKIPCGSHEGYYSRWNYFSNFVGSDVLSVNVYSADSTRGTVSKLTLPPCQSPTAVLNAVANNGYRFSHWNDGNSDNPRTITVISDTSLVGFFDHIEYDTIQIHDTTVVSVPYPVHDTTYIDVYVHDTTTIIDTVTLTEYVPIHDTTYIDVYVHDTTTLIDTVTLTEYVSVHDTTYITQTDTVTNTITVYDTITNTVFDTIINTIYDTTVVFNTDTLWLHDTVFVYDTIYIHDTIVVGVGDVETVNAKIYTNNRQIVVEGADGNDVWLYDVNGRILAIKQDYGVPIRFDVPASGTYMIKIGDYSARKVVVIR